MCKGQSKAKHTSKAWQDAQRLSAFIDHVALVAGADLQDNAGILLLANQALHVEAVQDCSWQGSLAHNEALCYQTLLR